MRIWALLRKRQLIMQDVVLELDRPEDEAQWHQAIGALCFALHQSRPVILRKHLDQLNNFSRTVFLPADFMEVVDFQKMEIEIFPEKEKKATFHGSGI